MGRKPWEGSFPVNPPEMGWVSSETIPQRKACSSVSVQSLARATPALGKAQGQEKQLSQG